MRSLPLSTFKKIGALAIKKFSLIDGAQRAASFAYYTLFSLFPLVVLFVTCGTMFLEHDAATKATIAYLNTYFPLSLDNKQAVFETIGDVLQARKGVSVLALVGIAWGSLRFLTALVSAVNMSWNTAPYSWWRLPLKSLTLLILLLIVLLFGLLAPTLLETAVNYVPGRLQMFVRPIKIALRVIPLVILFLGFSCLYKIAPRRKTSFNEVWAAAIVVTILLWLAQRLFVVYASNFADYNVVYGTFGGVMALLVWIDLSGAIIIFGGCVSAAQSEVRGKAVEGDEPAA